MPSFDINNIKRIELTMRHPVTVFKAMRTRSGDNSDPEMSGEEPAEVDFEQADTWERVTFAVAKLKALRELDIWFDHNKCLYWTEAHDRAALASLVPLTRLPNLKMTVKLPNHFRDNRFTVSFTIE